MPSHGNSTQFRLLASVLKAPLALNILMLASVISIATLPREILAAQTARAQTQVKAARTSVLSVTTPGNSLGAIVPQQVQVPNSMRSAPFDVARTLNLPPHFQVAVYARLPGARFEAIAPNGDLLVSQPGEGKVALVRPNPNGDPTISDFVTGLRKPQDIVFHKIGATTYVYISETHQINRFIYNSGDLTAHDRQIVVTNLPDSSSPELHGTYGHELKNIALDADDKLYVSIGSSCNACTEDTVSNPVRGAIYQYNADGSNGRLFARGLRNAEGLALLPGTNQLWAAVNNRDNIEYPLQDSTGNYGKVVQSYVDNHPPEEFTRVRDGGNYGWPFANPNPDTASGYDNMPFDLDVEFNADGHVALGSLDRIDKGIQAHSAPLGLTFLQNTTFPAAYRAGAVIALHGSWNRTQKTGYKLIYFPWDSKTGLPGEQVDLVTGWLNDAAQTAWGRPVDAVVDSQGNLLISDDTSGTVYKLSYVDSNPQPQPQAVSSLTLINADTGQPIASYESLVDGATLNLTTLPTKKLSIRANTNPDTVGSVVFSLDGNSTFHLENYPPYDIAGDNGSNIYYPWTPTIGDHTLTVTPYTGAQMTGKAGSAMTIHFKVVEP